MGAFHIGAPLVGAADCAFAVGQWGALMPLAAYPVGTPEYPDRLATLVVECARLENTGTALCGPGIERTVSLSLPDPGILAQARFPLGLGFFLTCGEWIAGLPRTTRPANTETH